MAAAAPTQPAAGTATAAQPAATAASATAEAVMNALNALHLNPQKEIKDQADKYLIAFSAKAEAWTVCHEILTRPNLTPVIYHFAANTLRIKIENNFGDLAAATSRANFRDALVKHLQRFKAGPPIVRATLGIAVASLAVLMTEWQDALSGLAKLLGGDSSTALCLIDVLTALPEEVANERLNVSSDRRQQAAVQFAGFGKTLLDMLWRYLSSTKQPALKVKVLVCFYTWVKQGGITLEDAGVSPLFAATFDGLAIGELFETCVDVILIFVTSKRIQNIPVLLKAIVTRVLALVPMFDKATKEGDVYTAQNLQRIFVDLGETCLAFILEGSEPALQIVAAILKCAAHREASISSNTFNFWYILSRAITVALQPEHVNQSYNAVRAASQSGAAVASSSSSGAAAAASGTAAAPAQASAQAQATAAALAASLPANEIPAWMDPATHTPAQIRQQKIFGPAFGKLALTLKEVMRYPAEYDSWKEETKDDAKTYRHHAQDVLLDAAYVVGPRNVLQMIWETAARDYPVYAAAPAKNWHSLEAALYCVRSIARVVEREENDILPQVMTVLPKMVAPSGLRYTATLIIARYADWLNHHPTYLKDLLQFVVAGLKDREVMSSSALAFKHVCDGCASHIASQFLDPCFGVYASSLQLPLSDQKEIIEGMACVVCVLPAGDKLTAALHKLLQPIVAELNKIVALNVDQQAAKEQATAGLAPVLDRLAEVYKTLNPQANQNPDAVCQAAVALLKNMWPLMEATITKWKENDRIMERLTRIWKYAIKATRLHFSPLLQQMVTVLAAAYTHSPHSSFLYVASICVDTFGDNEVYHKLLGQIYTYFSKATFAVLKDSKSFVENPDIVEDYFEMMARFVAKCPAIVFGQPNIAFIHQAIQIGLFGLTLQHHDALSAVCNFFGTFLASATATRTKGNSKRKEGVAPTAAQASTVQTALKTHGQALVTHLISGVTGGLPKPRWHLIINVIEELVTLCKRGAIPWFQHSLTAVPDTTNPTKTQFLAQLFGAPDARALREAVYHYAAAVRHARR